MTYLCDLYDVDVAPEKTMSAAEYAKMSRSAAQGLEFAYHGYSLSHCKRSPTPSLRPTLFNNVADNFSTRLFGSAPFTNLQRSINEDC